MGHNTVPENQFNKIYKKMKSSTDTELAFAPVYQYSIYHQQDKSCLETFLHQREIKNGKAHDKSLGLH